MSSLNYKSIFTLVKGAADKTDAASVSAEKKKPVHRNLKNYNILS